MSRFRPFAALLGLAAACCSDPAAGPPAAPAAAPPVMTGTASALLEKQRALVEEQAKDADTVGHGLLASFEARVYDPRRDSGLDHAEGTITLTTSGGDATYRFAFDSKNPEERPVTFEKVSQPASVSERTMADVRDWANLACLGAFPVVAYYRPPVPYQVAPSTDRKNRIVIAPVFRTALSVSYSVDSRDVVVGRAEWTDANHKYVTSYDWDPYGGGRFLLRRETLYEGSTTDFDYADQGGFRVLDRVHVKDRERPLEAVLTYTTLRRRTP